ncbi:hypothetical protein [Yoonia sp. 2307UL14-13]|uniref:COG3904 family protein n=1 Tax=Yoonia sp. 2307UL14-13 TaxID=3126506 RepID=UPI0030B5A9D0
MKRIVRLAVILIALATNAAAQKHSAAEAPPTGKFALMGATLIYNSDNATGDAHQEIEGPDIDELRALLRRHSNIRTLQLTSSGGRVWAGNEMARIVLDHALDTRVEVECSSSCVTIFLAGDRRQMTKGSRIGFHQTTWSTNGLRSYYKNWREDENWRTPFDFGSWIYQDTQHETAEHLRYMIDRGVDPLFAIETKMARPEMWFPTRQELETAGVLRD